MKNIVFFVICLVFVLPASANSSFCQTTINGITVHDFGTGIIISLPSSVCNSEGCENNTQLFLDKNHPFFKEMYSALLSAFHTQTKIDGWVNTCQKTFKIPVLTRLDMRR